jgi:hypothetical protein
MRPSSEIPSMVAIDRLDCNANTGNYINDYQPVGFCNDAFK